MPKQITLTTDDRMRKRLRDKMTKLERRYNPDWDLVLNAPSVTWADNQLLEIIEILVTRIDDLEEEVKNLRQPEFWQ